MLRAWEFQTHCSQCSRWLNGDSLKLICLSLTRISPAPSQTIMPCPEENIFSETMYMCWRFGWYWSISDEIWNYRNAEIIAWSQVVPITNLFLSFAVVDVQPEDFHPSLFQRFIIWYSWWCLTQQRRFGERSFINDSIDKFWIFPNAKLHFDE